jgi:hypothetical protein
MLGMQISRQNDKAFVVGGDFARAGARTILWGGAKVLGNIFLNPAIFIWIIRNLFNRNKSGRCAPYKSKEIRSYESKLSTSGPLRICRRTSADLFSYYFPMQYA